MHCSPRRTLPGIVATALAFLGLASVSYVLGAASIRFRLPPATFLNDAFSGGAAWWEKKRDIREPVAPRSKWELDRLTDQPGKTCDGYTLYSNGLECTAVLTDMKGNVVHKWRKSFRDIWPSARHIKDPTPDDKVFFSSCRLFPNGDLLASFQTTSDTPYGYGLAKLDKDSNVIWTFEDNVHHEMNIGPDDGKIYLMTQRIRKELPQGLEWIPSPCLVDSLVVLSSGGKELARVPILEAFRDTPYRILLDQIRNQKGVKPDQELVARVLVAGSLNPKGDILHMNSVDVLTQKQAPMFPMFEEGQVLVSLRELNALAVLDVRKKKVVWATVGPWRGQHSAQFLDNGHLLLLDNRGVPHGSRLIEYDPRDQSFPWTVPEKPGIGFRTGERGVVQRLPNGNTFFIDSENGSLREVTQSGELVWHLRSGEHIAWGRRYLPDEVAFLGEGKRPRP
jgi:hypothetical protein